MEKQVERDVHQEHDEHFDLEWDDNHVFPDVIFPDLDFMFEKMN